jgi:hypothetical protein
MNKFSLITSAIFMVLAIHCYSQPTLDWSATIASDFTEHGNSICADVLGNAYVTGRFQDTVTFDSSITNGYIVSQGSTDIFVAKYSSSGAPLWYFGIGSSLYEEGLDVICDNNGSIYVTGYFQGSNIDFNPGPGINSLSSTGVEDIFVAKYDSLGNYIYAYSIGSTARDMGHKLQLNSAGAIVLTGIFSGAIDADWGAGIQAYSCAGVNDVLCLTFASNGSYMSSFAFGGPGADRAYSMAIDLSDNFYLTGYFADSCDFDPSPSQYLIYHEFDADIFVAKYNPTGQLLWVVGYGGTYDDFGRDIEVCTNGDVVIIGDFRDATIDVDPSAGTSNLISNGGLDVLVARYSSNGSLLWAYNFGGTVHETGKSIAECSNGDIVISGSYNGINVNFDPNGTFNLNSWNHDVFIARYNPSGLFVNAYTLGGSGTESAFDIFIDAYDNLYMTGYFTSTVIDFDLSTGFANANNVGNDDGFVVKYGLAPTTIFENTSSPLEVFASPNPSIGNFRL